MASAARDVAGGTRVGAIQAATVASSANMTDHLSIMQLGLDLTALVRPVEHILADLRVWHLL